MRWCAYSMRNLVEMTARSRDQCWENFPERLSWPFSPFERRCGHFTPDNAHITNSTVPDWRMRVPRRRNTSTAQSWRYDGRPWVARPHTRVHGTGARNKHMSPKQTHEVTNTDLEIRAHCTTKICVRWHSYEDVVVYMFRWCHIFTPWIPMMWWTSMKFRFRSCDWQCCCNCMMKWTAISSSESSVLNRVIDRSRNAKFVLFSRELCFGDIRDEYVP